ncbi:MAG: SAM-dependent methyltransferase, partial [Thiobacillaceae bacterium]
RQFLRLGLVYLYLLVPFLTAALALCLAFSRFGAEAPRLYGADILGAGLGALGVIVLLMALPPQRALLVIGALGFAAAALNLGLRRRPAWALLAMGGLLTLLPGPWLQLKPLEYKDLVQTLKIMGTRVVAERSGPLGVITVVASSQVPFRHAPGLSLAAAREPPEQLGLFIDGDGPLPVVRYAGDLGALAYLDGLTWALPYHLLSRPRVLVLGAGGGEAVLQALYHRARSVDAVEVNPQLVQLIEGPLALFSGRPYGLPGVRVHIAEARAFVAGSRARYDLIQLALVDAFGASAAGLTALAESYLYTVEALDAYLDHLAPGGLLAITRWIDLPPRDLVKLAATAIAALEARGVADPGAHLALIRSWRTGTLLVSQAPLSPAQIERLRAFCRSHGFDVDWYPGMHAEEANRYNQLDRPYLHEALRALLGPQRQVFIERYKYRITPASDDRPFHFHFFRWESLPEWLRLRERGGVSLMEWGYPVLVATLFQASVFGVVLILLPLVLAGQRLPRRGRGAVLGYFALLGLAFMFVEIAFIQRFMLFLGHPLYAVAVVLAGFLLFAGLGSRLAGRLAWEARRIVLGAALVIAGLALAYLSLLPPVFGALAGLPDAGRIGVSLALIAPLALAMGMPFPLGLKQLAGAAPAFIPWAWGINACVSVIAAVLATWLAMHLGFSAVVGLAVVGYLSAAAVFRFQSWALRFS